MVTAGVFLPTTRPPGSTGRGWRWTGRWAKLPPAGKTGLNLTDRGKRGVKRSLLTDCRGVALGAVIDGANRNDRKPMRRSIEAIPVARPEPTRRRSQHLCPGKGFDQHKPRALAEEFASTLHLHQRTRRKQAEAKRRTGGRGAALDERYDGRFCFEMSHLAGGRPRRPALGSGFSALAATATFAAGPERFQATFSSMQQRPAAGDVGGARTLHEAWCSL